MKMIGYLYAISLLGSLCASSCESDDTRQDAGPLSDFYLTVSADAVQLSQQNAARQALEIAWSGGADDGSTRYTLDIGIDGDAPAGAGSWSKSFARGERACVLTHEELNRIVVDECNVREAASVRLKVRLTMNTSVHWKLYSVADSAYVDCSLYKPVYPEQRHKAPMYWSPYEYNYEKNSYMPEDEWQANIDWVAANLKSYGYTLV